ncbi:T-cell-specific surface glycoprotein CD28 homolog [Stegastes partitus]|uniref:T-cell-specific surface glycoprotein CD28 homolog n=1 Tax=Stegastes partitus TaxID=144197 RepID=A0A3B5AXQ8_9TELE|nr:PREDICTED: T-cell-specific surface glycoprotein CD28 homolog [Stegastes partitus]
MLSAQDIKMGLCWILIILLGCGLSRATESTCNCEDEPEIHYVSANGSISFTVPCPNVTGEDLTFVLRKGKEVIYNHTFTGEEKSQNHKPLHGRLDVKPYRDKENKFVAFNVTEATAASHGIYSCRAIKVFPPPYITEIAQRILIVDEEIHCPRSEKNNSQITTPEQQDLRETPSYPWIWILVVAVLGTYSLAVTIFASVNWMKLKNTDSQSDYMNTKPRAHRGNKKKRGVQNPIPRYL